MLLLPYQRNMIVFLPVRGGVLKSNSADDGSQCIIIPPRAGRCIEITIEKSLWRVMAFLPVRGGVLKFGLVA